MERKRHPFSSEDEDEEDKEEDKGWEFSQKKRMRMTKNDSGHDDCDDDDDDDEEEEEDANEQPGPSTLKAHKQRAQENRLFVSCGYKTGVLDTEKFRRSEKCIKSDGCWFFPTTFEAYAGRSSCRKWKATIIHENKPLQFWMEKGRLTTKGFKCRQAKTKKQIIVQSSGSSSEELEIQSSEETKEDDVEDQDSLPSSEVFVIETEEEEEETGASENGGEVSDSDADISEEEDKMEKTEMGDEDDEVAAHHKHKQVFEEMGAELIPLCEKNILQKEVKIIITRLQVADDDQSMGTEDTSHGSLCKDLYEDVQTQGEKGQKCWTTGKPSSITEATQTDPSQTSASPIAGCVVKENGEEFTQSHERKEGEQRDTKMETGDSPTTPSPFSFSTYTEPKIEDTGLFCNHTANLTSTDITEGGGFPTDETSDATPGHDAAELQVIKEDARFLRESQAAGSTQSSDSSCNLDTMDLDQLRREKIKMQLKVLKLQEEYYTLKNKELKK